MRPAILMPLKTRDGVAEAPIEPGLRTLCEPCETGPRLKLWRLIVPAKPLPIPIPEILMVSPGSKASTVIASPSVSSRRPAELDQAPVRLEPPQVAELGLARSSAPRPVSKASWTAS